MLKVWNDTSFDGLQPPKHKALHRKML